MSRLLIPLPPSRPEPLVAGCEPPADPAAVVDERPALEQVVAAAAPGGGAADVQLVAASVIPPLRPADEPRTDVRSPLPRLPAAGQVTGRLRVPVGAVRDREVERRRVRQRL